MILLATLFACLPFLGLVLTVLCLGSRRMLAKEEAASLSDTWSQGAAACPFDALIRGSLAWGLALVFCSNVLSAFDLLAFPYISAFWCAYLLAAILYLRKYGFPHWSLHCKKEAFWGLPLAIVLSILVLTLCTALLYPPNTQDSMGYHLPKVMQWWQNHTLAHFYTSDVRQTSLSPFAELVLFHSFVLSENDYLANLVQWTAFLGTLCVAASTASLLGAGRQGSWLAAIFFVTLPMGISQATSTQTDLTVAFWLSCMANRFFLWQRQPLAENALFFGIALGLGILTKGTAYVIGFPFVAVFALRALRSGKKCFFHAVLAGLLALALFGPHLYRNYTTYGEVSSGTRENIVPHPTPASLLAVAAANILSNDPALFAKEKIEKYFSLLVARLGINEKEVFPYGGLSERVKLTTNEDYAQNPIHTLLLLASLAGFGLAAYPKARKYRYFVLASIFLFCLLLTWQPWITRLQVPLFALAAPLVGCSLEALRGVLWKRGLCALLVLGCLPSVFWTPSRPLIPVPGGIARKYDVWNNSREDLYFANAHGIHKRYAEAADLLVREKPQSLGLLMLGPSFEYPLWAILRTKLASMPKIRHVQTNTIPLQGGTLANPGSAPHFVFVLTTATGDVQLYKLETDVYKKIY